LAGGVETIRFVGQIRYWDPAKGSGLAVVDVPEAAVHALGGMRQQHVAGTIGGVAFASNVMPAGGGRLALSVSKPMMAASGLAVGDAPEIVIVRVGRD
jgi:Domain of unknown function (DUF1905)